MAIKYINICQSKALKKFTQIRIFGLKINHLAILMPMHDRPMTKILTTRARRHWPTNGNLVRVSAKSGNQILTVQFPQLPRHLELVSTER
jgi:hypothetical protein